MLLRSGTKQKFCFFKSWCRKSAFRHASTPGIPTMINIDQIKIQKLFEKDYLFQASPTPTGLYLYIGIIFIIFIAIAIYLAFNKKKDIYTKLRHKFIYILSSIGVIGLALLFFRYEGIAYLGSRIILITLLGVFIFWLLTIVYYRYIILPKEIRRKIAKDNFEKYLP